MALLSLSKFILVGGTKLALVSHSVEISWECAMWSHSKDLTGPRKSDLLRVLRFQIFNTPLINTLDVFSNLKIL